jgi:hypothetical protein
MNLPINEIAERVRARMRRAIQGLQDYETWRNLDTPTVEEFVAIQNVYDYDAHAFLEELWQVALREN